MRVTHSTDSLASATPRMTVADFSPSGLRFKWDPQARSFTHNVDRDLHLFVIWETARVHEPAIIELISAEFRVLAEFDMQWSSDRVLTNFERLYGAAVGGGTGKQDDAGTGAFALIIVEDPEPRYQYRQNVSGHVELTNVRAAAVKKAARDLAGGYRVHSSNNIREFFRDATLLLGPTRLNEILDHGPADPRPIRESLATDLVGAEGWQDLTELAAVLRRSVDYVVLRNFEELPASLKDDPEVDVLTREELDFAAIVNGRRRHPRMGSGYVTRVGGQEVTFDIRWVGDGYLDPRWEHQILAQRVWAASGLAVPRADDYFFSLLYHAKIQKPEVKPAYPPRLRRLALDLGMPEHTAARATDDEVALRLLDGFLSGHAFGLPRTADREVHRNDSFVRSMELTRVEPEPVDALRGQIWRAARFSPIGQRAADSGRIRAVVRAARRALPGRLRRA